MSAISVLRMKFLMLVIFFIAVLVLLYFHVTKGIEYVDEKGIKNILQPIGKRIWEGRDSVPTDTEETDEKE